MFINILVDDFHVDYPRTAEGIKELVRHRPDLKKSFQGSKTVSEASIKIVEDLLSKNTTAWVSLEKNFHDWVEPLKKAEMPPRKHGELHPTKPYRADWNPQKQLVWHYKPDVAKAYDDFISSNKDKFLERQPPEHREILGNMIDSVSKDRWRHSVPATDRAGQGDKIRARHVRSLLMGDPNIKIKVNDPSNLTFTIHERHGSSNRSSNINFAKVSGENADKTISNKGSQNDNTGTGTVLSETKGNSSYGKLASSYSSKKYMGSDSGGVRGSSGDVRSDGHSRQQRGSKENSGTSQHNPLEKGTLKQSTHNKPLGKSVLAKEALNDISSIPRNQRTPDQQRQHSANIKATMPETTVHHSASEGGSNLNTSTTGPFTSTAESYNKQEGNRQLSGNSSSTTLNVNDATPAMKDWYGGAAAKAAGASGASQTAAAEGIKALDNKAAYAPAGNDGFRNIPGTGTSSSQYINSESTELVKASMRGSLPLKKSDSPNKIRSVASVAVINDGNILMGKRNDNGKWTLPGGHLEAGEKPKDAAYRELYEETGIYNKGKIEYLGGEKVAGFDGGIINVHAFIMNEKPTIHNSEDPDDEVEEWIWVPYKDGIAEDIMKNLHSPKNVTLRLLGLQYDN